MEEDATPESLEALYADLLALSESRLSSIQRLGDQLETHMKDFKKLLDKKTRNDKSRGELGKGKLQIAGVQYSVNDEFKHEALQLADDLNLDELEAARILFEAQDEAEASGQPLFTTSLIRFHQRRKCLLDCLRVLTQQIADVDTEEDLKEDLRSIVSRIILPQNGGPQFTTRCLASMADIRQWLQGLADKAHKATMMGQTQEDEDIEYQRVSLVRQHESLAAIIVYLIKENHANVQNFSTVLDTLKKADKYDNLLVHLLVVLSACISRFGGIDTPGGLEEARSLHDKVTPADEKAWTLPYVQSAFRVLWLAEHSGWYGENYTGNAPENQLEDESKQRAKQFTESLKDGAFDFLLSVSADVKSVEWHDPARHGLRQWLQKRSPPILADNIQFSMFIQDILMEQFETFVEGFITNMPDVLRKLRIDEDEQRQLSKDHEHDLDLERFIVITSYTFENRPKAALEAFWDVPDGSMMGFVHWASKRASTPLVSAFCEMLQSIAEDEECATAVHHFLLDEGTPASGKMRRTQNLTWNIIFKELEYFMKRLNPASLQAQYRPGNPPIDMAEAEPESVMMLECYLRLITRLAAESEAARTFLAQHPSFQLGEMLFQLASSSIGPRLRACAFTTLRALLSNKTRDAGNYIWSALDVWVGGGYTPGSLMPKTQNTATTSLASMTAIMSGLASGFEEPNAYVQLLHALVLPYPDDSGLHDELPFPENLGSSYRHPGVESYVDFAINQVFGRPVQELNDLEVVQRRLLQLTCLEFIATCLDTFNEDLIILASQANISIDNSIRATSLQNYVILHPFSRVMEWMFNSRIMSALFNTVNQDPAEVARVAPDSPLVLCLLQGIHVINAILELQPTYLDIIKPLIKDFPSSRRSPLPSGAYASFEDGVLNHLKIFRDLGRYCGTGHPELVIASLKLLERLSSSPRLSAGAGRGSSRSRALAAMDEDAETISKILLQQLQVAIDINEGQESSAHIIKSHILDFLIACLRANPGQPSIAHLLLGFKCVRDTISVDSNSTFNNGVSLFHTIMDIAINEAISDETGVASWMASVSLKSLQVMRELWSSPISSAIVLEEMRLHQAFFSMFVKEIIIQPGMLWDGVEMMDPSFTSVECISEFLTRRALITQYLSTELRLVAQGTSPSLKRKSMSTLMGSTSIADDETIDHAMIFDMFDFMETELESPPAPRRLTWFDELDIAASLDDPEDPESTHNMVKLEELLVLRKSELEKAKRLENPQDVTLVNTQAQDLIQYFLQDNRIKVLNSVRLQVLKSWVQLVLVVVESGDFDEPSRIAFVDRALQTIMPRLDANSEVILEATELAKLAKALVFSLNFASDTFKKGEMAEKVGDRLFTVFQVSLSAINTIGTRVSLKEYYYNICFRYLIGMSDNEAAGMQRRHNVQNIKSAGERFMDVICDDAQSGEATCRISALLLINALVRMGKRENSKYITDALNRLNFISLLVESIRKIQADLSSTSVENIDMQLSYIHAKLAVLLQVCQTRAGAANVCGSGLFHNVKESGLFSVDPELGVEIGGPGATEKFYELLDAIARILCAAVLSRGDQNQQTLEQGRKFITENRPSIVDVLKKSEGYGSAPGVSPEIIEDLAESYQFLISYSKFLESEEQVMQKKTASMVFTSFT